MLSTQATFLLLLLLIFFFIYFLFKTSGGILTTVSSWFSLAAWKLSIDRVV